METLSNIIHNILEMLRYEADSPMIFSSGLFWALFLVFLPVFALLRRNKVQMMVFVLVFSLYFYYKSSGVFFLLLVATSLIDWSLSRLIARLRRPLYRRLALTASILVSLSVLGYFKYANFFLWTWNTMVQSNFQPLDIILPVGISFYTFQSISYVVDVYRGRLAPTATWLEYAFFLSFFPALVAGPIVRADYFLPQIHSSEGPSKADMFTGLWLVILGVIKKAIIADYIAQYNDLIFSNPTGYSGFESLMGTVGYVMQIYCDFSGYSDMAIGIALIMGFKLAKNFDFPYKAQNITAFWRQWHISLSSWLRDYVYIPLGGNRRGTVRTYVNNFLTMLVGGLWHGAGWKFVLWGGLHGIGLAVHKACRPWLDRLPDVWPVRALAWSLNMFYVSLLFIFFRADSASDAWDITRNIFTNFSLDYALPFLKVRYVWVIMMVIIITAHSLPRRWYDRMQLWFVEAPWSAKLVLFILVVQIVIQFMSENVAPFIYFQF